MENLSIIPQLKKKKNSSHGSIIIRAFIKRVPAASLSIGQKILIDHWDAENKQVKEKAPNAALINMLIQSKMQEINASLLRLEIIGTCINKQILTDIFQGSDNAKNFLHFCRERIKENYNNWGTIKAYLAECTKLEKFKPVITFADIDYRFLERYKNYMRTSLNNNDNTIWKTFKFLNTMLNLAIKHGGIIKQNPFEIFNRGKYDQPQRVYLEIDEVERIESLAMHPATDPAIRKVCIYFLLICFSGLRFEDAMSFDPAVHIIDGDRLVKHTSKGKGALVNIKLYNRLSAIIELVKQHPYKTTNQEFNRWLKHIAMLTGINKNLTAHVGRHTFGGFLSDVSIDKEVAQQMLGHRDRKATDIYYHLKNKRVDQAAGKLNNL